MACARKSIQCDGVNPGRGGSHLEAQAAEGLGVTQGEMAEVTQLLQLANGDMSSLNSLLEGQLGGTDQLKDKLMNKLKGKLFGD